MGRTVLVVDAIPEARARYREALEAAGYEVLEAGRGGEALAMIVLNVPDAVVKDISLPDVSGWDVLDQLKSDSGMDPVRVVVYSAHGAEAEAAAKGLGDVEMLSKPVDVDELVAAVDGALGPNPEPVGVVRGSAGPAKLDDAILAALEPDEQIVANCCSQTGGSWSPGRLGPGGTGSRTTFRWPRPRWRGTGGASTVLRSSFSGTSSPR